MELFLNICWVLLLAPALCFWLRHGTHPRSLRCLVTLACMLVLLFPVISATDDLYAMQQKAEEPSLGRILKQFNRHAFSHEFLSAPPAQIAATTPDAELQAGSCVFTAIVAVIAAVYVFNVLARAPPAFSLS